MPALLPTGIATTACLVFYAELFSMLSTHRSSTDSGSSNLDLETGHFSLYALILGIVQPDRHEASKKAASTIEVGLMMLES